MTHRSPLSIALVLGLCIVLTTGCGAGSADPPPEYAPVEEPEPGPVAEAVPVQEAQPVEPPEAAPAPEPASPPVQVVAAERTPIDGRHPSLRITAPRNGRLIRRGDVMLRVRLRHWELAPAPGRHVHVIVDNEAYIAVRNVSRPLNLNELVRASLGHELAPGTHVVRVFPSRHHHESVKEGTPFATVTFHYRERTADFAFDAGSPMLTYSRPKGCAPLGQRMLLDFYLANLPGLAEDGYRVQYTIDDVTGAITTWAPHFVENLTEGEHRIRLQLVGANGQPVDGLFNDTERTFRVAADCSAPPPAAPEPSTP